MAPMDLLLSGHVWPEELQTSHVQDPNKADVLDSWLPRWIYVKSRLAEGEIPRWNPYISGGQPALPLLFDSYLSPSFLIFLVLGNGLGYSLVLLVRLFIALMLFGGFPAVAGYTLYLLALIFVWTVLSDPDARLGRDFRVAAWAGAAVSVGVLLTGLQLLPGIEYLATVDVSWRQASSVPLDKLPFLFSPFFKG